MAAQTLAVRGPGVCGDANWREFERSFLTLARNADGRGLDSFRAALSAVQTAAASDEGLSALLALVADEHSTVMAGLGHPDGPRGSNVDPAVPALISLLDYWSHELPEFRAIHDESTAIRGALPLIRSLHDPDGPKEVLGVGDDRTILVKGNAREVVEGDSSTSLQLQVADILAGACAYWSTPGRGQDQFAMKLSATKLAGLVVHEVWPSGLRDSPAIFST